MFFLYFNGFYLGICESAYVYVYEKFTMLRFIGIIIPSTFCPSFFPSIFYFNHWIVNIKQVHWTRAPSVSVILNVSCSRGKCMLRKCILTICMTKFSYSGGCARVNSSDHINANRKAFIESSLISDKISDINDGKLIERQIHLILVGGCGHCAHVIEQNTTRYYSSLVIWMWCNCGVLSPLWGMSFFSTRHDAHERW